MLNDLIGYLYATDQLDEFFGMKKIIKCPGCNTELLVYEDNLLYCPNFSKYTEYKGKDIIHNKTLTLEEKRKLDS